MNNKDLLTSVDSDRPFQSIGEPDLYIPSELRFDVDLEGVVLSSILTDRDYDWSNLTESDFVRPSHKWVFRAYKNLYDADPGKPVTFDEVRQLACLIAEHEVKDGSFVGKMIVDMINSAITYEHIEYGLLCSEFGMMVLLQNRPTHIQRLKKRTLDRGRIDNCDRIIWAVAKDQDPQGYIDNLQGLSTVNGRKERRDWK